MINSATEQRPEHSSVAKALRSEPVLSSASAPSLDQSCLPRIPHDFNSGYTSDSLGTRRQFMRYSSLIGVALAISSIMNLKQTDCLAGSPTSSEQVKKTMGMFADISHLKVAHLSEDLHQAIAAAYSNPYYSMFAQAIFNNIQRALAEKGTLEDRVQKAKAGVTHCLEHFVADIYSKKDLAALENAIKVGRASIDAARTSEDQSQLKVIITTLESLHRAQGVVIKAGEQASSKYFERINAMPAAEFEKYYKAITLKAFIAELKSNLNYEPELDSLHVAIAEMGLIATFDELRLLTPAHKLYVGLHEKMMGYLAHNERQPNTSGGSRTRYDAEHDEMGHRVISRENKPEPKKQPTRDPRYRD